MILALDNFISTNASSTSTTLINTSTHLVSSSTVAPSRRIIIKHKAASYDYTAQLRIAALTSSYSNNESLIQLRPNEYDDDHQNQVSMITNYRDEATKLASEMPLYKRHKFVAHTTAANSNISNGDSMITRLPPEILMAIFLYLQRPEDLRVCESTCKRWRAIIVPILWRTPQIYFTPLLDERTKRVRGEAPPATTSTNYSIRVHARHPLDDDAVPVNLPLNTYGQWIRQLDLWPAYSMVRDSTILRFMDACTRLRSISLHGCIFVTDMGVNAIAECCGNTLSTINLSYCVRITDKGIAAIAQHASRTLEQINLKGCSLITDYGLQRLSACCHLHRIRLSELPEITDIGVWALANGCRQLEWIDLTGNCGCSDASAEAFSRYCPKLRWLSMARIPFIAPESVIHHHHQQQSTNPVDTNSNSNNNNNNNSDSSTPPELSFAVRRKRTITTGLSDRGLEALAIGCPRLTFLDLSFHHNITDRGVEQLARTAYHLVHVALIGCTHATTRSLYALVELRHSYGKMACITMGGTPQFNEETLHQETQGSSPASTMLRDWKRADATSYSSRNLPVLSWLDTW
jgi:hypothetical protein